MRRAERKWKLLLSGFYCFHFFCSIFVVRPYKKRFVHFERENWETYFSEKGSSMRMIHELGVLHKKKAQNS